MGRSMISKFIRVQEYLVQSREQSPEQMRSQSASPARPTYCAATTKTQGNKAIYAECLRAGIPTGAPPPPKHVLTKNIVIH